jgi:hypothetical protein
MTMMTTTSPVRTVADALERFMELHPGRLGPQTLSRIEDIAGLAVTIRCIDDDGIRRDIPQGLNVVASYLCDEACLNALELAPVFGRPLTWCDQAQRAGRSWVEAYAAENARKGQPHDIGRPSAQRAAQRVAMRARRRAMA